MIQEEFLRYLTEQAFNVAKSESKPRRNIAYKDIGKSIHHPIASQDVPYQSILLPP